MGQAVDESLWVDDESGKTARPTPGGDDLEMIDQNLVKALTHPMRVRILEALQGRSASSTELAKKFRRVLVSSPTHANALLDLGCIEQVRTQPRRGTIEHFHTAVPRSFIGHQDWRKAPLSVRGGVTNEALRR